MFKGVKKLRMRDGIYIQMKTS